MNPSSNSSLFGACAKAALYAALFLAMQAVATIVYISLGVVFGGDAEALTKSRDALIAVSIFADVFCVGAVLLIELWCRRDPLESMSVRRFSPRLVAPIIVIAVSFYVLMLFALNTIPFPKEWIDSYNESSFSAVSDNVILTVIFAVIAAPIAEEIVFRAMVFGCLRGKMNIWLAAATASIIFGAMHGTIIWFLYATLLGMVINVVFIRVDSIAAPMLFHVVFNAVGLVAGRLLELGLAFRIATVSAAFVLVALSSFFFLRLTKKSKMNQSR